MTMAHITLLDQQTINKIAAGEVVERPAAVVKELVENAIDAGANSVTVEIKDGGTTFIRITDNGCGIPKEEVKTAFLRHATSKIKSVEDLLLVSSLGFRGEALASIASVAFVELVTKTAQAFMGTRYVIEGGVETAFEEIGCPEGTTFIVRNLFYNTPARRKFLKSPATEAGYISDLIERMAVSHPNISFRFINNNQLKLNTSGNNKLKDIIYHVYGRDIAHNLLSIDNDNNDIQVVGFVGKPIISRGNRNYENYFINGRYIKSPLITKAIEDAFKPYSMSHRYPFTALHFTMDTSFIDVNVHPTKMEIRFKNGETVYQQTYDAISRRLKEQELIPDLAIDDKPVKIAVEKPSTVTKHSRGPEPFEKVRTSEVAKTMEVIKEAAKTEVKVPPSFIKQINEDLAKVSQMEEKPQSTTVEKPSFSFQKPSFLREKQSFSQFGEKKQDEPVTAEKSVVPEVTKEDSTIVEQPTQAEQMTLFEERFITPDKKASYRIVGQVFQTFWIVEFNEKMLLVDQHVAHEKILFERLLKKFKEERLDAQMLMPPIILSLNPREEETLKRHLELLERIGFEIEHFGGKEYSVRAVPSNILGLNQREILMSFIDELVEVEVMDQPDIILEKIASMSCKAAIKGNQLITHEEFKVLLDELMELENPYFCPHGRPIIISMSRYEVEKKFKRIV